MTICPSIAVDSPSARSKGAPSPSFGIKGSVGFGSTASTLHPRLCVRAAAQESTTGSEHRHWVNVIARDHALLRLLLERFERAEQPHERVMLLRLALDFHGMHSVFESGWMQIPALRLAHLALDDLAEQIECTPPISALHRARGLHWKEHLFNLMRKEEIYHREISPKSNPFPPHAAISTDRALPLTSRGTAVWQLRPLKD